MEVGVEDSGPGLADDALTRLGERFFRAADAAAPGSGLGWSIVRRIADLQQLQVRVQRSPRLGGLCVVLEARAPQAGAD